ncbi:hypothetical protein I6J14_05355 [Streptococcus dysgalactiae]|uniref:hypothetical protein n=1 Tax=Streptococcus dysgalactiae TaxID=1334 RepID=UPI000E080D11|nr:hypothetical protein [Streptococcus dysgalactiae]QQT02851.1 hypothetical protein I6J14_05355 [Streptococcus dysgalactiae]SUN44697.1 Uncharacterised protein [Streptococcus dysgalactiae subsp. dysgalactiae]SUN49190.1 Uncharacterised protein [Streptococcus dysgalactiae]SUN53067.1 Uncharacterised protein [Streptococcus dysgalactiae]SUN54861.1 Uncharacterised protein [Streptococcus dysgalactiae]
MVQKSLYTSSYTSVSVKEVTKTLSFGSNTTLAKMQEGELYIKQYSDTAYDSNDLLDFYYTDGDNIWYFKSRKSQAWDDYGLLTGKSSSSSDTSLGLKLSKNGEKAEGRLQSRWTVWHINSDGSTDDSRISASEMITFEPYVKNTDISDYQNGNVVSIFYKDMDGAVWTFNANKKYVIKKMSYFVPEQEKDNVVDFRGVAAVIYNSQHIKQIIYNHEVVWSKLIKPITVNELSIQVQNNSASIIIYERNYSLGFFKENYGDISSFVIDGNNYKVTEQLQMSDRGTFLIIYGPVDGQSFDRASKTVTFNF